MQSPSSAVPERDQTSTVIAVVAVLFVVHMFAAARLELMFDEAYYRLWADHLAWGYYDHPPLVALWIRISTALFGTSEFGVRALGVIATTLGSLAIWLMARDLFAGTRKAAQAVLIWNACPLIGVGAIVVTPDTPLLFGWSTALWALCRVYRSGDWRWWLMVGVGAGLALEAKYTALFLGPGIALAMATIPRLKHWWTHPAPYAGGAIALALFAPNILWNARHDWETFAKQFGRVADAEWTLRFLVEFFGSQIGLLGPLTFVLVLAGLWLAVRPSGDDEDESRRLLAALAAPLLVYFTFHSLHDRVQGNWLAPLYPVFALIAADAAETTLPLQPGAATLIAFARRWTVPLGLALTAMIYVQAIYAPLTVPAQSDPTSQLAGWRDLARDLDSVVQREGAGYVLTQGYALTGLLKIYGREGLPVLQYNERYRWTYDPSIAQPDPTKPGLYIVELKRADDQGVRARFASYTEVARLTRRRHGAALETYLLYRLERPTTAVLDTTPAR